MAEVNDVVTEMVTEISEGIAAIDSQLAALEKKPGNQDALNEIFKQLHSIKGVAGFFDFSGLELIADAAEALIDKLRTEKSSASPEILATLRSAINTLRDTVKDVADSGKEPEFSHQALIKQLNEFSGRDGAVTPTPSLSDKLAEKLSTVEQTPPPTPNDTETLEKALTDADETAKNDEPTTSADDESLEDALSKAADSLCDEHFNDNKDDLDRALDEEGDKPQPPKEESLDDALDAAMSEAPPAKETLDEEQIAAAFEAAQTNESDTEPVADEAEATRPNESSDDGEKAASDEQAGESSEKETLDDDQIAAAFEAANANESPDDEEKAAINDAAGGSSEKETLDEAQIATDSEPAKTDEPVKADAETKKTNDAPKEPSTDTVSESDTPAKQTIEAPMTDTVAQDEAVPTKEAPKQSQKNNQPQSAAAIKAAFSPLSNEAVTELSLLLAKLVQYRNSLQTITTRENIASLDTLYSNINTVTNQLQDSILNARQVPESLLYELCQQQITEAEGLYQKPVELIIEQNAGTLDQAMIDSLRLPLELLIKNAVHHGIEKPDRRKEKHKPEKGKITVSARQMNGRCHLCLHDDGKGLLVGEMREKLVSKALIEPKLINSMSDEYLLNLLLDPLFFKGKPQAATSILGEEIFLVKDYLEGIGGSIEVSSQVDSGTQFEISIPNPFAVVPCLICCHQQLHFALPASHASELKTVNKAQLEQVFDAVIYRHKNHLLPVINLSTLLTDLDKEQCDTVNDISHEELHLVIIKTDGYHYALQLDEVKSTQHLIIQPLSKLLLMLGVYQGTTILGDEQIAMVLDLKALARKAKISSTNQHSPQ